MTLYQRLLSWRDKQPFLFFWGLHYVWVLVAWHPVHFMIDLLGIFEEKELTINDWINEAVIGWFFGSLFMAGLYTRVYMVEKEENKLDDITPVTNSLMEKRPFLSRFLAFIRTYVLLLVCRVALNWLLVLLGFQNSKNFSLAYWLYTPAVGCFIGMPIITYVRRKIAKEKM